jgi:hypothetical protein
LIIQLELNDKAYTQSNISDLMNASTASLDVYEAAKSTKMSFFFHDEAIRHLAKLSRVFVRIIFIVIIMF